MSRRRWNGCGSSAGSLVDELVVTKYATTKRGAAGDRSGGTSGLGSSRSCSSGGRSATTSPGAPPSSSAAATLRSIPSAKKWWISSFEAPLSRSTATSARRTPRGRPAGRPRRRRPHTPGAGPAAGRDRTGDACRPGPSGRGSEQAWSSVGPRRGGLMKDQTGPLEAVADDGQEQLALRAEQLEQVRLRDADGPRDRLGRRAASSRPRRTRGVPRRRSRRGVRRRSGAVVAAAFMP